jgi:anti-anti-sigma factor
MSSQATDLSSVAPSVAMTRYPGVDVVSVAGDFDVSCESFVGRLVADTKQVTQAQVILDLSEVTFMDAGAVGLVVRCRRTLAARSADLSLACPEGPALRVLRLLRIERILPIYPDRNIALLHVTSQVFR